MYRNSDRQLAAGSQLLTRIEGFYPVSIVQRYPGKGVYFRLFDDSYAHIRNSGQGIALCAERNTIPVLLVIPD